MKKRLGYTLLGLFLMALTFGLICIFRYAGGAGWLASTGLAICCWASSGAFLLIVHSIVKLITED